MAFTVNTAVAESEPRRAHRQMDRVQHASGTLQIRGRFPRIFSELTARVDGWAGDRIEAATSAPTIADA